MKRIVSLFLSLLILCSVVTGLGVTTTAAEVDVEKTKARAEVKDTAYDDEEDGFLYEGSYCYYINDEGTATIFECYSSDKTIYVPSKLGGYTVTQIDGWAFDELSSLKKVIIPSTIEYIGASVFSFCENLESIVVDESNKYYDSRNNCNAIIDSETNELVAGCDTTVIPSTVEEIGPYAFRECDFTKINIPESVKYIWYGAFENCVNLESIYIPKNVEYVDGEAFYWCWDLASIVVDKNNPYFDSRNNCNAVIETATNEITVGCYKSTIPSTVKGIGNFAFYGQPARTSIVIPEHIKYIGSGAFLDCENLDSIVIKNDYCEIGLDAFAGTAYDYDEDNWENNVLYIGTHLVDATWEIEDNYTVKKGTTTIANSALSFCDSLKKVTVPDSVRYIGDCAFMCCPELSELVLPTNTIKIGDNILADTAYYENAKNWYNDGLYVGNHLVYLEFDWENPVTSISVKSGTKDIAENVFMYLEAEKAVIPEGIELIGDRCLAHTFMLEEITLPQSLTYIGEEVFINSKMTKVTVPKNVKYIGDYALGYNWDTEGYYNKIDGFTISGYTGTAAEKYANDNGFKFISLGNEPTQKPTEPTKPQGVLGDTDGDKVVSVMDATAIQLHMAQIKMIPADLLANGDVDGDSKVSIMDATEIQLFKANLIPALGKR